MGADGLKPAAGQPTDSHSQKTAKKEIADPTLVWQSRNTVKVPVLFGFCVG